MGLLVCPCGAGVQVVGVEGEDGSPVSQVALKADKARRATGVGAGDTAKK